jgi:serine protease Do
MTAKLAGLIGACVVMAGLTPLLVARVTEDGAAVKSAASAFPADVSSQRVQDTVSASRRNAIVLASQRVAPAVVSVNVIRRETVVPRTAWEQFFGYGGTRETQGLGSGFIISDDGLVLTNEHVVHGATEIVVTLSDGRDFAAEIVGTDQVTDLALLRLRNASNLPVAPLGTSRNLIIGEWAIAIGNPFGFYLSNAEPTVTAGVISAIGRNLIPESDDAQGLYLDMIQTDASINPGNSGGPLVNALGQVIGVNASILTRGGGSVGLGFAIPIDRARRIADDLLKEGRVRRVWGGIDVAPADINEFGRSRRVQVDRVAPESPAARAGLRPGMVITSVGGRPVYNPLDWEARLLDARVGQPLEIAVMDGSRARTFTIRPSDLPSVTAERVSALADNFELITLTPAIRSERNVQSREGAVVTNVSDAVAARVGLRPNDVIVEINNVPVGSAEDAAREMNRAARQGLVRLIVERRGQIGSLSFYTR